MLDPAQNHSFRDHYLDVELDLSNVMFIATANVADTIPGPLLDRMEVIRFDGYTTTEKVAIARGYLWPRQLERNGLRPDEVEISDELLLMVATEYTREAGVRQLERELGKLLRKTATRIASGQAEAPVTIDLDQVRDALGRQKHFQESAIRTAVPGVATGLAVTGTGGDVLFVEATAMHGKPGLTLTGQLGDVMKESAQIALSYVRGHAEELGIEPSAFEDRSFHVHVPAGAIPKDGPSAGVTMVTALASLLSGRPVRHTVGMTGEVTLQGRVLPIGGVKQKVLAAHAAGLTDVILPERNRGDLDDVPEEVREAMRFHFAMTIDEVLAVALEPAALRQAAAYAGGRYRSAPHDGGVGSRHEHDHRPRRTASPRPGPQAVVHRRPMARRVARATFPSRIRPPARRSAKSPTPPTDDAKAALDAAVAGGTRVGACPPRERGEILRRAFEAIIERAEELALLMTLEMGKPMKESKAEIAYGAEFFRWFSEQAVRIDGRYARRAERPGPTADDEAAGRPVPADHAVELPAGDGNPQDRAGDRRRMHDGGQARPADAAVDADAGEDPRGGRAARRRAQPDHRVLGG